MKINYSILGKGFFAHCVRTGKAHDAAISIVEQYSTAPKRVILEVGLENVHNSFIYYLNIKLNFYENCFLGF